MADLIIEPSCDIHVVLDAAIPRPKIAVFRRDFSAAIGTPHTLVPVTGQCEFDFFVPGSSAIHPTHFVSIDKTTGQITPLAAGTNLVQVRLNHAGEDLYIILRIQVHQRLDGWWFGDESLPVVRHDTIAHSKVSIYALFDFLAAAPELAVPGDITGHGYVTLSSVNPAVAELDADGRGWVRGKVVGSTRIKGSLLGRSEEIEVNVTEVYGVDRNVTRVRYQGPAADRFNILFLSEGYSAADSNAFDQAVEDMTKRLFDARRHSPYRLLKSSFNVWKRFEPSGRRGVTTGYEVTKGGYPIPFTQQTPPGLYGLHQLVALVGLPSPADTLPSVTVAALKARWLSQHLAGYEAFRVADDVVANQWKKSRAPTFIQTRPSFFGLHLGARWGDRSSAVDRNPFVLPLTEADADPANEGRPQLYQARMYEWFTPRLPIRVPTPDPRRHAPELVGWWDDYLLRFVARLVDPGVPVGDPGRAIGEQWVPRTGVPRAKSQGLAIVLVNDQLGAGAAQPGMCIALTVSNLTRMDGITDTESAVGGLHVRLRRRDPSVKLDLNAAIDTAAHELGHGFNLGDEYEFRGGKIAMPSSPPHPLPFRANPDPETWDNLDYITSLKTTGPPDPIPHATPIDPSELKWEDCNRIALSDAIVAPSQTVGGSMRLQLGRGRARRWQKVMAEGKDVTIRALYITDLNTQLPIVHLDPVTSVERFVGGLKVQAIDVAADTVTVGGLEMPIPVPPMVRGSVLFLPRVNKAGDLLFLIPKPVMDHMAANHLPLTSNFMFDPAAGFCAPLQTHADNPPKGISGFHYPSHAYQVLGAYEGGSDVTCGVYRAAGSCKMRGNEKPEGEGEFCFLCKYLIVNRVDASQHDRLDKEYREDC